MQPQPTQEQPLSVPRRALDVEDYIDIVRRHRSWILGPAFVGLVLGVVTAFLWPDSYRAEGLIRIVPPQVPSRLIQTNISEEMTQRIQSIYQNITSRPQLMNVIQTYNLYPDDRKRLPMEDVIDMMRNDIRVGQIQGLGRGTSNRGAAFAVSYSYSDKRLAQKVCNDIITRFIDESTRTRSTQSIMTTEFFRDQLDQARSEMEELDAKLAAFRQRNMGQLPEQEQGLISRINALEGSIQNINAAMTRVNQEKLQLETNLRVLREQMSAMAQAAPETSPGGGPARDDRLALMDRDIQRLENGLATLRENYRENHPDVQRTLSYLEVKRRQREELAAEIEASRVEATKGRGGPQAGRVPRELAVGVAQIQSALQAKDMEMEELGRQMNEARDRIRVFQARLEASPAAQQVYVQLIRDRDLAQQRYNEMSGKMQISSMATDLENRKQGETLEILEQPIMPAEPYAPKREIIILLGLMAGVVVGIALASGRELRDTSLKNLKDVRAYTKLTVLGSIPLLENDFVVRRRRRLGWLAWSAAFLLGVLLMAGSVVYYYTSKA